MTNPYAKLRAKVERKGGGRSGTKSDLRFNPHEISSGLNWAGFRTP